jgi:hypothetical protein
MAQGMEWCEPNLWQPDSQRYDPTAEGKLAFIVGLQPPTLTRHPDLPSPNPHHVGAPKF